jgi:hypothetical protein
MSATKTSSNQETFPTVNEINELSESTIDNKISSSIPVITNKPFQRSNPTNKRKSMDFTPHSNNHHKENDSNANNTSLISSGAVRSQTKRLKIDLSGSQQMSNIKSNKSMWRQ